MPITQDQVNAGVNILSRREQEEILRKTQEETPTAAEFLGKGAADAGRAGLRFLQHFERPQEAMQAGVMAGLEGRYGDILPDMWKGFKLESNTGTADILDKAPVAANPTVHLLRYMESNPEIAKRLGFRPSEVVRQGQGLVGDMLIDPLVGASALGKTNKVRQWAGKVGDAMASTNIGRKFGVNPTDINYREFNTSASNLASMAQYDQRLLAESIQQLRQQHLDDLTEAFGGDAKQAEEFLKGRDFAQALERPKSPQAEKLFNDVARLRQTRKENLALSSANDLKARELGLQPRGNVNEPGEYSFMPRIEDPVASRDAGLRGEELGKMAREAKQGRHRELFKWVDEDGFAVAMGPEKMKNLETTIGGKHFYTLPDGRKIEVAPKQLSRAEVEGAGLTQRQFIKDPYTALQLDTSRKLREGHFLDFLIDGKNKGWLQPVEEHASAPQGWTRLERIPGMEHLAVPEPLVGRMEHMAGVLFDHDGALGHIGKVMESIFDGRVGEPGWYLKKASQSWSRNQLAMFPGYHFNNALGNVMLAYVGGEIPSPMLLSRFKQAGAVQLAGKRGTKTKAIFEGMDNAELYKEAARRGAADTSWSREMMGEEVSKAVDPTAIEYLLRPKNPALPKGQIYGPGKARKILERAKAGLRGAAAKGYGANQWAFQKGTNIEDNAKLAVFINELKRRVPKGTPTKADLDAAAYKAKQALFDYGDLTSFQRTLKTAMPFLAWYSNIFKRTMKDVVQNPQRLARLEEAMNFSMIPISDEDQKHTPEWMKESAAFRGFRLGQGNPVWDFGESQESGLPNVALAGRAVPYSTVNEFLGSRAPQAAFGTLLPAIKSVAEIPFNKEFYKDFDIDAVADGFGEAATAPITGGNYNSYQELLGFNRPDAWNYMLQTYTPFGRHLRTLDTIAETVGEATGNEFLRDPAREALTPWELVANVLTGGKFYPLDTAKEQRKQRYQQTEKIGTIQWRLREAIEKGRDPDEIERLYEMLEREKKKMGEL